MTLKYAITLKLRRIAYDLLPNKIFKELKFNNKIKQIQIREKLKINPNYRRKDFKRMRLGKIFKHKKFKIIIKKIKRKSNKL